MSNRLQGLQTVDWICIGIYACATIGIGWYFGRRQRSTKEYFVGRGNMNPVLIGISLFVTLLSTISYLSKPGEALGKGPVLMTSLLALPFAFCVVGYVLLPVYMRQRVTSAYELLESRLGLGIRLLGASMFIALRLVWMSLLVYLAAKAMTVMIGIGDEWIPMVVLITGFVAVIYTSVGGLQAVVVTDTLQFVLLLSGALLVIAMITFQMGGFNWFPTEWHPQWDTQPIISFDPRTRLSVFGTLLMMVTWIICTAGGDQTSVQRFMATRNASSARHAYAIQLAASAIVTIVLGLVGFALLGFFEAHPDQLPAEMNLYKDADHIFPWYIAHRLPAGIAGLVVSAMFAAAMSSIDSGVNSITAVVMTDFLDRFGKQPATERGHVLAAKILAFTIGTIVVVGSSFMGEIPGNITAVTNKTVNLLTSPIFGLFFFALFVPFAKPVAVWIATFLGIMTAAVIAFSGLLVTWLDLYWGIKAETFGVSLQDKVDEVTGEISLLAPDPISFQWIGPAALLVTVVVGVGLSWMLSRTKTSSRSGESAGP
jgi:SSS family solute:Na+ symporter